MVIVRRAPVRTLALRTASQVLRQAPKWPSICTNGGRSVIRTVREAPEAHSVGVQPLLYNPHIRYTDTQSRTTSHKAAASRGQSRIYAQGCGVSGGLWAMRCSEALRASMPCLAHTCGQPARHATNRAAHAQPPSPARPQNASARGRDQHTLVARCAQKSKAKTAPASTRIRYGTHIHICRAHRKPRCPCSFAAAPAAAPH